MALTCVTASGPCCILTQNKKGREGNIEGILKGLNSSSLQDLFPIIVYICILYVVTLTQISSLFTPILSNINHLNEKFVLCIPNSYICTSCTSQALMLFCQWVTDDQVKVEPL